MQLSEDEIVQKYAKRCGLCNRNTLLPCEFEWTCVSCGFSLIKRKHEFSKTQREKINFINQLKYAEHKIICICVDVYKLYESNDYKKVFEVLSTLKNWKLKMNNILILKYKDKLKNPDFEQNQYSKLDMIVLD